MLIWVTVGLSVALKCRSPVDIGSRMITNNDHRSLPHAYCETILMEKLPAPYGCATAARGRGGETLRGRRALPAFAFPLLKFIGLDG